MAPPATKRRKVDHVSSSDDEDAASFASFGDGENEEGAQDVEVNGDGSEDGSLDAEEGAESGDEEEAEDEEASDSGGGEASKNQRATTITTSRPATTTRDTRRKSDSKAHVGASAYASGTFKSNVFKLQVDELLGQIRPRHGQREVAAEAALHKLKKTVEQIPTRGPYLIDEAERNLLKEKVSIPFPTPRPPKDAKYKLSFAKPANVNVVGSFALKTSSRSRELVEVDMVVTMPGSILEDKDYLNHRYFYKRAYYLACIAAGLQTAHKAEFKISFKLFQNNPLKSILVVTPVESSAPASQWRVNIIPCVSHTQFAATKLGLDKNCVRSAEGSGNESAATPFYNSALRSDMLTTAYLKLVHGASKSCEGFKDACLLGSTWLRQRGFSSSTDAGGFGNFEWATLVALSLYGGAPNGKSLLSEGYSSYQLFKATLQLLAMKDFIKHPLIIGSASITAVESGVPVVWDVERAHNVLYKVGEWSYRTLRYEARSTLAALGDQLHDGFDATFILRVHEPLYRYDHVVQLPASLLNAGTKGAVHESRQNITKLYSVLRRGLGDRINHLSIAATAARAWTVGSLQPKSHTTDLVTVGLMVNSDNVKRTVDHGPSAEQKAEAAAFRQFWGEKAELRRFKDGSILESLVWAYPQDSGQSVLEQVVRYLLGHHFGAVTTDDLRLSGDGFGKLVKGGSDIAPFTQTVSRYKQFEQDIRGLSELPLSIRQIMPADPQLCYSSIRAPTNGKGRPIPADVTIQFEGSGRWPDDLGAIQRTKIAFLLMIDKMLQDSVDGISSRVGLENEGEEVLNQAFLDVTYANDATFRLRIYHDREQTLLKAQMKNKTTDPKTREVATTGLAKYKRDYEKSPAQTQAIMRLCTRFPALSGSIRLAKKWFASHLLTNHIPDEVVELLVVRTFTQPAPWTAPSSVQTGFLRTLFWISRWDWRAEPLVVDLSVSGDLKQAGLTAIRTNFEAWRKLDPAMNRVALFAASNLDHEGTTWTDGKPLKVIAGRMTVLANAACAEIAEKQLELEPASLFSSPLSDFDFVLHLSSSVSGFSKSKSSGGRFKNLELSALDDDSLIGYDPVRDLLAELENVYGSAVLLFYGGQERNVITGLWSPVTARRAWKVNLAYSTIPEKGEGEEDEVQASINKSAILAEISRLAGDLIERVEIVQK
ncbi:Putative Nrap protein domain 1 [Septoria linicola]|uniref:U3 small nucleolar RNA-associated protein 22 n=1 Tax=Septoria linicola TaxID=215465 RepID=A0A9Q9BAD6_9PEZI|nr:putative Nrap protein domain 1 [Septoria linicola]USW59306.1 Putative Nrap protein domain 1 [Septoria linicola]